MRDFLQLGGRGFTNVQVLLSGRVHSSDEAEVDASSARCLVPGNLKLVIIHRDKPAASSGWRGSRDAIQGRRPVRKRKGEDWWFLVTELPVWKSKEYQQVLSRSGGSGRHRVPGTMISDSNQIYRLSPSFPRLFRNEESLFSNR